MENSLNNSPVPSPYANPKTSSEKKITASDMEAVKKLLGVECLFIVADTQKHDCDPEKCSGHMYSIRQSGFSPEQLMGIAGGIAERLEMGIDVPGDKDTP